MPTEDEIRRYYETAWLGRRGQDLVLIKTLLYTGVRVYEVKRIRLDEVDLDACLSLAVPLAGHTATRGVAPREARRRRPCSNRLVAIVWQSMGCYLQEDCYGVS
ncbi:MAG TPA: hypothetical protein VLW50_11265 [Streptosporangiaceae bacterium]|nr:hypothetical protein [Streptosporangiaceae bacterium]